MIRFNRSALYPFFTATIASVGLAGCPSPNDNPDIPIETTPQQIQQRIDANLPNIIESVSDSVAVWSESDTLDSLLRQLESLAAPFESLFPEDDPGSPDDVPAFMAMAKNALLAANDGPDGEEGDDLEDLEEILDEIFSEENHEGDGVFRINSDLLCADETGVVDQECVDFMDPLELRIRALVVGEGLDLGFRIGPQQNQPFVVELQPNRVTAAVELAETKAAIEFIAAQVEEDIALPRTMLGELAMSLVVHGESDVELQSAVRKPVTIEMDIPDTAHTVAFTTEVRDPMFAIRANSDTLDVDLDVGRTTMVAPLDDTAADSSLLAIDWQGLSFGATLAEGSDSLTIRNIGIGNSTSTVNIDEQTIFAADLNAQNDRRFDLTITPDDPGLPQFAFNPAFDLSLDFNLESLFAAMNESFGDEEAALFNETYRIAFTGQDPVAQPVEFENEFGTSGALRMVAGEMVIAATNAGAEIVVSAGQCLVEASEPAADAHPITGLFAAGECP